jgi:hypothetical protein
MHSNDTESVDQLCRNAGEIFSQRQRIAEAAEAMM